MSRMPNTALPVLLILGAAALAGVAACGDDDFVVDVGDASDASTDGQALDATLAPSDAGTDASAGAIPNLTLVSDLVHVTSATRVCLLSRQDATEPGAVDALPMSPLPLSNAGLRAGTSSPVFVPSSFSGRSFRPVIFYVDSLEAFGFSERTCPQLMQELFDADSGANGSLIAGIDFEFGLTAPAGTLTDGVNALLLLSGCPRATSESAARRRECGDDFVIGTSSDFRSYFHSFAAVRTDPTRNRVQYLHGSWSQEMAQRAILQRPGRIYAYVRFEVSEDAGTEFLVPGPAVDDAGASYFPFLEEHGPLLPAGFDVPRFTPTDLTHARYDPTEVGWIHLFADAVLHSGLTEIEPGQSYVIVGVGSTGVPRLEADGTKSARYYHDLLIPGTYSQNP